MRLIQRAACTANRLMALHPGRIRSIAIRGDILVVEVARKADLPLVPSILEGAMVDRRVTGEVVAEHVRGKVISM